MNKSIFELVSDIRDQVDELDQRLDNSFTEYEKLCDELTFKLASVGNELLELRDYLFKMHEEKSRVDPKQLYFRVTEIWEMTNDEP